ncbi:MAG: hypothetical protein U9N79_10215 [Actinomycetota bacterium]|nr:hypothetical protein [Actinomycetota bacterium]
MMTNQENAPMHRLAVASVAIALLAAACSSGSDADGVASLTTTEGSPVVETTEPTNDEQALLNFSRCMRDQGVDFPDPIVDADGYPRFDFANPEDIDRDALFEAGEACLDLLEGVVLGLPDFDTAEFNDTFLEYAACMREHGFEEIPDRIDMTAIMRGEDPPIDPTDPDFIAADEQCRDIFAEFRAGIGQDG